MEGLGFLEATDFMEESVFSFELFWFCVLSIIYK